MSRAPVQQGRTPSIRAYGNRRRGRFDRWHLTPLVFLAACGSVPPQYYYVLTPQAPATTNASVNGSGEASSRAADVALYVEPAIVPEIVDRPQIVVSAGDNRVTILEQQRWGEPLRAAIPQVVATNLSRLIAGVRVSTSAQTAYGDTDYRLALEVQRFESRADAVAIDIAWTLRNSVSVTRSGRASARETVAAASAGGEGGYGGLAAAHSRALAAISRDIAIGIAPLGAPRTTSKPAL
jgi:uncharacterized lipoprotein YmbA